MTYTEQLEATKQGYPFTNWRENFDSGLEQYTAANCNKAQEVFDTLIAKLIALGSDANRQEKVALFKNAVLLLNDLNEEIDDLIETGEREDLCGLFDEITIAAGMNPADFAEGEGIADEWREW